jgi:hypothetical protein
MDGRTRGPHVWNGPYNTRGRRIARSLGALNWSESSPSGSQEPAEATSQSLHLEVGTWNSLEVGIGRGESGRHCTAVCNAVQDHGVGRKSQ